MILIFMESTKGYHWHAGKRILRYVSDIKDLGIMYSTLENFKLIGYTNSDNGGNTYDKKNTFGYTFHFGIGVVSWNSKKQPIVSLYSTEAEYVMAISTTCQVVWMHKILKDLS